MKNLFNILLFFLICFSLHSQSRTYAIVDVVTLKDGKIKTGRIIQEDDNFVELETDEFTIYINKENVANIEKGILHYSSAKNLVLGPFVFDMKGPRSNIGFGGLLGNNNTGFSLSGEVHYFVSHSLGFGLGASYDSYRVLANERIIPVYLDVRKYLLKKKLAPYIGASGGYGFPLHGDFFIPEATGGYMAHVYVGLHKMSRKRTGASLSVGYMFQKAKFVTRDLFGASTFINDILFRRITARLKFHF